MSKYKRIKKNQENEWKKWIYDSWDLCLTFQFWIIMFVQYEGYMIMYLIEYDIR